MQFSKQYEYNRDAYTGKNYIHKKCTAEAKDFAN